jgi:alpha-D-ribose 1-methylphosphonate 5-triphosphate synthase subunit PhnG
LVELSAGSATARGAQQDATAADRKRVMATLAQAQPDELVSGLAAIGGLPAFVELRPAQTGLVMVRGRIGGDGTPFNVGEATVTRAAVRLASGETGFAYRLGRDEATASLAALCDAMWQATDHMDAIEAHVLAPIRARVESDRVRTRARTAATRVDFFTLVRGED